MGEEMIEEKDLKVLIEENKKIEQKIYELRELLERLQEEYEDNCEYIHRNCDHVFVRDYSVPFDSLYKRVCTKCQFMS